MWKTDGHRPDLAVNMQQPARSRIEPVVYTELWFLNDQEATTSTVIGNDTSG